MKSGESIIDRAQPERTLDPADWDAFRKLGHTMLDDMLNHLSSIRNKPAWQPMPDKVKKNFNKPLPAEGEGGESVYREFLESILPYPNGNIHPRFWGWVQGTGIPLAMMADMLASGLNPHLAGFNQAPVLVEHQVLAWMSELMGMPEETSGLLVSGGTMANITALVVARNAKAGFNIRDEGLQNEKHRKLILYGSTETHRWAESAAELLGLGRNSFHRIPVDGEYRIDLQALRISISEDRRSGLQPFCVIGNAGTVNTGAIDDLESLARLCYDEKLWFHVDGAFGALARIVPELKPLVAGIEKADSIAFDLHKWMYLPYEIACVLIRDGEQHRKTFASGASYIAETSRGVIAGGLPFAERGIELTRGFKALKAWMTIKAYGMNAFTDLIRQNVDQAKYLADRIKQHPNLELAGPVPLNVVCFRYLSDGLNEDELNKINEEILIRVQESGIAVPSGTTLNGKFVLRVAIVNHRSRYEDFDMLIKAVVNCGEEILKK